MLITGFKVLKTQGLRALIQKANKKFLFNRSIKTTSLPINIDSLNISKVKNRDIVEPIKSKVSIIIPTKNAGNEFEYILRRIKQQEGINEIEIIIIDSGSEDNTIEIAKKYSSAIFKISPEDFHHARTRNDGAEKATGEYIVFTVQDAIPIGNDWLHKLLTPICFGEASAVSTIQVPRSDADLFTCWSYWALFVKYLRHEKDLIFNKSNFDSFEGLSENDKRAVANLDNVSLGIKKDLFNIYKFHADYAKDLELGIRLIKDRHSLMFQSSNAVIHSHNRIPLYYLKRSYSDRISICKILNIERDKISIKALMESNSYIYALLKQCLENFRIQTYNPSHAVQSLIKDIYFQSEKYNSLSSFLIGDDYLNGFFENIAPIKHEKITNDTIRIFCDNLMSFAEYLSVVNSFGSSEDDLIKSIYKIFSNVCGAYIAANSQDDIEILKEGI